MCVLSLLCVGVVPSGFFFRKFSWTGCEGPGRNVLSQTGRLFYLHAGRVEDEKHPVRGLITLEAMVLFNLLFELGVGTIF